MGLDKARLKEITDDVFSTLKRRPRLTFLAACLLVLLVSAWGTQRFADRLLSSLPANETPDSPTPMTQEEIQRQVAEAQRINDELRAHRQAPAYAMERVGDTLDTEPGAMPDGAPPLPPAAAAATRAGEPDPNAYIATDEAAEPIYTVRA